MLVRLLSVFALSALGLWKAIPLGFALGLPAPLVGGAAGAGSLLATLGVAALGGRVRDVLGRRRDARKAAVSRAEGQAPSPSPPRLGERIWRRYGVVGLGLLGPGLTGGPLAIAIGLQQRAPARRLIAWTSIGVVLWAIGITTAGALGALGVGRLFGAR